MEEDLRVNDDVTVPAGEISFVASRSGGPGGQHVNKTSSRVTVQWNVAESIAVDDVAREQIMERLSNRISIRGVLTIHVDTERSQYRNRIEARERLAEIVAEALRVQKKRRPTKKSRAVDRRRLEEKKKRSETKRNRSVPPRDDSF